MPAQSERQRKAMAAEYSRRKEGKKPQRFKDMSQKKLKEFSYK